MTTTTTAAVVDGPATDPVLQQVQLEDLRHDEVLVRVVSTGVCHTDVAWADGEFADVFPVVLGHESAGVVEAVGSGVSRVSKGQRVAIALAHHCGHCAFCESGRPMLCDQRLDSPVRFTRDGQPLTQGFGSGGFSELTVVRDASTIPLPDHVPLDVAAIVGCATSTGLGAVFNIAEVQYGSTVAILGAGGIGLNLLMGCLVAGAERIVVADPDPVRREQALGFGATDVCDASVEALLELEPKGYEFVFESAGLPVAMETAIKVTGRGATVTLIGAAAPGATFQIDALDFVPSQRRILGCLTGNVRPNVDFDRYFRLFARGRLPLDKLVTGAVPFADIAKGFELSRTHQGIRTVVHVTPE
jgi:S-(hydroxymethyl)glutathione dehydrogenase/alcohol dehydrogenase